MYVWLSLSSSNPHLVHLLPSLTSLVFPSAFRLHQINSKDRANQHPLHRAATTGSDGFVQLLLAGGKDGKRTRLNTQDRMGEFCFLFLSFLRPFSSSSLTRSIGSREGLALQRSLLILCFRTSCFSQLNAETHAFVSLSSFVLKREHPSPPSLRIRPRINSGSSHRGRSG